MKLLKYINLDIYSTWTKIDKWIEIEYVAWSNLMI